MILRVFSKPVLAACALVLGLGVTASYGDDDHEHTGADPRLGDRVMQACGGWRSKRLAHPQGRKQCGVARIWH